MSRYGRSSQPAASVKQGRAAYGTITHACAAVPGTPPAPDLRKGSVSRYAMTGRCGGS
jgi:hypothetical protein